MGRPRHETLPLPPPCHRSGSASPLCRAQDTHALYHARRCSIVSVTKAGLSATGPQTVTVSAGGLGGSRLQRGMVMVSQTGRTWLRTPLCEEPTLGQDQFGPLRGAPGLRVSCYQMTAQ